MIEVQQQRKPCRRFVNVSAARRGCQTTKHAVQIAQVRTLAADVSKSAVYSGVCARSDLWTSKHNWYWILSTTDKCNS